jgi:hypothetical protein
MQARLMVTFHSHQFKFAITGEACYILESV